MPAADRVRLAPLAQPPRRKLLSGLQQPGARLARRDAPQRGTLPSPGANMCRRGRLCANSDAAGYSSGMGMGRVLLPCSPTSRVSALMTSPSPTTVSPSRPRRPAVGPAARSADGTRRACIAATGAPSPTNPGAGGRWRSACRRAASAARMRLARGGSSSSGCRIWPRSPRGERRRCAPPSSGSASPPARAQGPGSPRPSGCPSARGRYCACSTPRPSRRPRRRGCSASTSSPGAAAVGLGPSSWTWSDAARSTCSRIATPTASPLGCADIPASRSSRGIAARSTPMRPGAARPRRGRWSTAGTCLTTSGTRSSSSCSTSGRSCATPPSH